jgi:putative FmdB family regulatory protein
MPTYDYYCSQCDTIHELFHSMSAPDAKECPSCHQPSLKKQISLNAGIIFKGGGFYETDYKQAKATNSDKASEVKSSESHSKAPESSAAKASESKSPAPTVAKAQGS